MRRLVFGYPGAYWYQGFRPSSYELHTYILRSKDEAVDGVLLRRKNNGGEVSLSRLKAFLGVQHKLNRQKLTHTKVDASNILNQWDRLSFLQKRFAIFEPDGDATTTRPVVLGKSTDESADESAVRSH